MIPAKAIQAAHAAICEQNIDDCLDPAWRGKCVKAVEAAAPHMFAQALEDAVHAFPLETIVAPDNAVVWMMRRAEEMRSQK